MLEHVQYLITVFAAIHQTKHSLRPIVNANASTLF